MKVKTEGPGLVRVDGKSEEAPEEDGVIPIILTSLEWELLQHKRFKHHLHDWEYRQARPVGQFKVVATNEVRVMNLPSGRICRKCGKIEWVADKERAKEPWKQTDFTPNG